MWGSTRHARSVAAALVHGQAAERRPPGDGGRASGSERGGEAGDDGGNRPELLSLLRTHDLSAIAASRVAQAGQVVRRRSLAEGVEVGVVLDRATGRPIGPARSGTLDRVSIREFVAAMREGHWYLQLHTHPGNTTFSGEDLLQLLHFRQFRTMAVVGHDGHWYLLTKPRRWLAPDPEEGYARWLEILQDLRQANNPAIAAGRLTEGEAHRQELHGALARVAGELELRYDDLAAR